MSECGRQEGSQLAHAKPTVFGAGAQVVPKFLHMGGGRTSPPLGTHHRPHLVFLDET